MRRLRRDEGIVMVLVGLLLVVLLGMAGLAIDLGALYSERRQLRNGADAAALAIAEDCGTGAKACDENTARATAQRYAILNSDDGASGEAIPYPTGSPNCLSPFPCVVVTTSTEVRVPLMSLFGLDPVIVTSAATAIFDHPLSATGLALAVEADQYQPDGQIHLLYPHGWLQPDPGSECWATVTAGDRTHSEPNFGCTPQYLRDYVYDRDVLIPLYNQWDPQHSEYRIAGFAYFHVTGYDFGHGSTSPGFSCDPSDPEVPWRPCLRGYFTPSRTIYSGTPGGPDYGIALVKLTG